jgi:putative ABC transport system ATP-binding protein
MPPEVHGSEPDRSHTKDKLHKKYSFTNYAVPTGALDYNTSKEILKLIETVNHKYGNTIVMVTHNDAIKDMADRVVKLRDGMIRRNYQNEQKIPAADLEW